MWVVDDIPGGLSHGEFERWLAPGRSGRTLLTTRSHHYDAIGAEINVGVLSPQEGFGLFAARRPPVGLTRSRPRAGWSRISAATPWRLTLRAPGCMPRGERSYAAYRDALADPSTDELGLATRFAAELPGGHEASVTTTLARSISELDDACAPPEQPQDGTDRHPGWRGRGEDDDGDAAWAGEVVPRPTPTPTWERPPRPSPSSCSSPRDRRSCRGSPRKPPTAGWSCDIELSSRLGVAGVRCGAVSDSSGLAGSEAAAAGAASHDWKTMLDDALDSPLGGGLIVQTMTIGQLAARSGLSVRRLRFYADAGVLPEAARSESGYRLFDVDAVARARLVRTLRELGVGLDDVKRVLTAQASLADVAAAHTRALDAQIRTLRLQRAVLGAVARSTDPKELQRMTDLTTLTAEERSRILEDYLDAVFGDRASPVADRLRMGAPELPEDPSADQVAAWVELVELLRDPDYVQASRRMAERGRAEGSEPDDAQFAVKAIGEHAGAAVRAGVDPSSPEALAVIEHVEANTPGGGGHRAQIAERIEAFTDRRVLRYWTLVGIVNGWSQRPMPENAADAWEWYARALRAHAG